VPHFIHKAIMVPEVLQALRPTSGGRYVDGTIGAGGHAEAVLSASSPNGFLFGCDRDGEAVAAARRRLAPYSQRCEVRQGNFAELAEWIAAGSCDGVLLDLGVSSPQLDQPERGFSFQQEGPLDMRMDSQQPVRAADLVNGLGEEELAGMFRELGDEPQARRLARAIVKERQARRFETTGQLARLIERLAPRSGKRRHPATRVFQALRMAVNDEASSLRSGLAAACTILKPGGRLAVITFHSLEDRIVKQFGRERSRGYVVEGEVDLPELRRPQPPELKWVSRKAIQPSAEEVADNPRARSGQMRVMEKLQDGSGGITE
jgi:16S rRNA (cytosine1402-N4)-methyltransferase